jgi:hypothetical protein
MALARRKVGSNMLIVIPLQVDGTVRMLVACEGMYVCMRYDAPTKCMPAAFFDELDQRLFTVNYFRFLEVMRP